MGESAKNINGFNLFLTTRLIDVLDEMKVPKMRRDISNLSNVKWLMRNLSIQNGSSPNLAEALSLLKQQSKQLTKS